MHLGLEIAQIHFDVPAHSIEFGQFLGWVEVGLSQGGEQKEALGAEPVSLDIDDEQATLDGILGDAGLELVVTECDQRTACWPRVSGRPSSLRARLWVMRTQRVRAGPESSLHDTKHAEVAISMNKRAQKAWPRMIRQARACSLTHEAAMTQSIAVR